MLSRLRTTTLATLAAAAALCTFAAPAAAQTLPPTSAHTPEAAQNYSDKQVVLRGLVFTVPDARLAEVTRRYPELLGHPGPTARTGRDPEYAARFAATLKEAERKGLIRVESRPFGLVRDGEQLHLSSGAQIGVLAPPQTTKGLKRARAAAAPALPRYASKTFDIRPRVERQADGDLVHLEISLEFDSFTDGGDDTPSVQRQSLSTTVSTRDGETVVLGGMRDEANRRRTYFALTSRVVDADARPAGR